MTKRIFRCICLVGLAMLLASVSLTIGVIYSFSWKNQTAALRSQTAILCHAVSHEGQALFSGLQITNCRITWVDSNGKVLYDSTTDTGSMENHLQREEILEALQTGYGESQRYSSTLMERSIYCAQKLNDGTILRLSISEPSLLLMIWDMFPYLLLVVAAEAALSLFLAYHLSRYIVRPINTMNLDEPLSNRDYPEIQPLLQRLHSQQQKLRRKQEEFNTVIENMSEGLVLLSSKGKILSINTAAASLLNIGPMSEEIGLSQIHNLSIYSLVHQALNGHHAEMIIPLKGGTYQADANSVFSEGEVIGVILLLIDLSEQRKAELLRQEFTANVSHELKTPLHAISGYAELLKDGLVLPQDQQGFSANIYREAQRLIRLVEDILRLSRLDEGRTEGELEEVDLRQIALAMLPTLSVNADKAGVSLQLEGNAPPIRSHPALVQDILANLCSNAIQYNRPGGSVKICIGVREDGTFLQVSDTGIGIPQEQQERIFERFYRVDKSHSKSIGGTGLGLSIVKHAAAVLGARITLNSTPGSGTTVTVVFP